MASLHGAIPVRSLLDLLGYSEDRGYLPLDSEAVSSHRFELAQAKSHMDVIGTFGLWIHSVSAPSASRRFRPLVYIAKAARESEAQEIHRRVWSQGLVPFLIVATPQAVFVCQGFSYASDNWPAHAKKVSWGQIGTSTELSVCKAQRLRSSLSWRDFAIDRSSRVDVKLLEKLRELSGIFIDGKYGCTKLHPQTANSLIGRFLYVYLLRDRQFIGPTWLTSRKHHRIELDNAHVNWTESATWAFLDDLDELLNGSIFPLSESERGEIRNSHVQMLRHVLRHNQHPSKGGIQLSFFDIYFPTLRTETLSAVYEQFFANENGDEQADDGAFYTPPFLVDYILDQVEQLQPIEVGVKVLDPSAGSGVFLVGAYRRLLESYLSKSESIGASVDELRRLLVDHIFGIEKNLAACRVAAFSLYLTLLDYVSESDVRSALEGTAPERLFPPLVDRNILKRDFFDTTLPMPPGFPEQFECIVGNPPWGKVHQLRSEHAVPYHEAHSDMPIDQDRAAELFAWKCAHQHLKLSGTMGIMLNIKSLISPSADDFAPTFSAEFAVRFVSNLSHLRYRLFKGARAPAAALFVQKAPPRMSSDTILVHSPTLASQPVNPSGWPWAIMVDRAQVRQFRYAGVTNSARGWFEALMLSPFDRRLLEHLNDRCDVGEASRLGDFERTVGLELGRGGSPSQTGVSMNYILGAGNGNGYLKRLQLTKQQEFGVVPYELPASEQAKVTAPFRYRFGGKVLLLTRNDKPVHFVKKAVAFNSSLHAINFKADASSLLEEQEQFLVAIQRLLNSGFLKYAIALYGHLWMLDARRFEMEDLKRLPVPFVSIADERVKKIAHEPEASVDNLILDLFGIPPSWRTALQEFVELRRKFKDGGVPADALVRVASPRVREYCEALSSRLGAVVGGNFATTTFPDKKRGVVAVLVNYSSPSSPGTAVATTNDFDSIIKNYDNNGIGPFGDSLSLSYDRERMQFGLVKPIETMHWTFDRAYADCDKLVGAISASGRRNFGTAR